MLCKVVAVVAAIQSSANCTGVLARPAIIMQSVAISQLLVPNVSLSVNPPAAHIKPPLAGLEAVHTASPSISHSCFLAKASRALPEKAA